MKFFRLFFSLSILYFFTNTIYAMELNINDNDSSEILGTSPKKQPEFPLEKVCKRLAVAQKKEQKLITYEKKLITYYEPCGGTPFILEIGAEIEQKNPQYSSFNLRNSSNSWSSYCP